MITTEKTTESNLESYFEKFRNDIIGINQDFVSPFGKKQIIYKVNIYEVDLVKCI